MIHPARTMPFAELAAGLIDQVALGNVSESLSGPLAQYTYTRECVYEKRWNRFSLLARGLILDLEGNRVAATPFPKFFNVGEAVDAIPALPFETFEKLDGSLIIIFCHLGTWCTATKGSFGSPQAKWASRWLDARNLSFLDEGTTYLAEAIYPENRIVVRYEEQGLILLSAYDAAGAEFARGDIEAVAVKLGTRVAGRFEYGSVADLIVRAATLPATEEGYVLRFSNGHRLKVKGDEYRRIHALVSRITPIGIWDAMVAGDDLEVVRRELPEEFWGDYDQIVATLRTRLDDLTRRVAVAGKLTECLSAKELGLGLDSLPFEPQIRRYIFAWRKTGGDLLGNPKARAALMREIRPTANNLPGYTPSYAINRVLEESA